MGITYEKFKSLKPNQLVKIIDTNPLQYFYHHHYTCCASFSPAGEVGKFMSFSGGNCARLLFREGQLTDCHLSLIEKVLEEEPGITIKEFNQLKPGQKVQFKTHVLIKTIPHLLGKIFTIDSIWGNSFTIKDDIESCTYQYSIIAKIIDNEDTSSSDDDEMPPLVSFDTVSTPLSEGAADNLIQRLRREDLQEQKRRERARLDALEQERNEQAWANLVSEISKPRKTLFKFTYTVKDQKIADYLQKRLIAEGARCTRQTTLDGAHHLHICWD